MRYPLMFILLCVVGQGQTQYEIATFAGSGRFDITQITGDARGLRLPALRSVALDPAGNAYVADIYFARVFRISPEGEYSLFAGNGAAAASGDGGPAAEAGVPGPTALRFHEGEL